nr:immunoglobulin heavy chain junction region [Mus musculus]
CASRGVITTEDFDVW